MGVNAINDKNQLIISFSCTACILLRIASHPFGWFVDHGGVDVAVSGTGKFPADFGRVPLFCADRRPSCTPFMQGIVEDMLVRTI
jgi:hypothetical protein